MLKIFRRIQGNPEWKSNEENRRIRNTEYIKIFFGKITFFQLEATLRAQRKRREEGEPMRTRYSDARGWLSESHHRDKMDQPYTKAKKIQAKPKTLHPYRIVLFFPLYFASPYDGGKN